MTIVNGKVETLKNLKRILSENGIDRFKSISEINTFTKNYDIEKKHVSVDIEREVDIEIDDMRSTLARFQNTHKHLIADVWTEVELKLKELKEEQSQLEYQRNKSLFLNLSLYRKARRVAQEFAHLEKSSNKIVNKKTQDAKRRVDRSSSRLDELLQNKKQVVAARIEESIDELAKTKEVIDELYPIIAGAIGENAVVNKLKELSDDYYLINDFSIEFDPPIYNKKEDDSIFSIQADHLLLSRAGIFLLETKNWSEKSIQNLELRSPVEQIKRTGYAMFVLLNSESSLISEIFKSHHWGSINTPVRNVIVMTNGKPKEEFKHVKVLTLDQLNGYIQYFEPVLSSENVMMLFDYLKVEPEA